MNRIRRATFPTLDRVGRPIGRPFVRRKGREEYVCSVVASVRELEAALRAHGYSRNHLSTLKYVSNGNGRSVEIGTMVYREDPLADHQFHCYYFVASEPYYTIHVHQHRELSWLRHPIGHQGPDREPAEDYVWEALDGLNIRANAISRPMYGNRIF